MKEALIAQGLSIVIPVYNEEESIPPLIAEIKAALDNYYTYEIVIVDDASTDNTWAVLKAQQQHCPQLRIAKHRKNLGKSGALVTSVKVAKFAWCCSLDGDLQNNPADIPTLCDATEKARNEHQTDKVFTMGYRAKRHDSWLRLLSSRIGNNVRRFILRDNCKDSGCGIVIFPRDLFLALPHFKHSHRFLPVLFQAANTKIIHLPVNHRARQYGVAKYGVWNRLWVGIVDLFGVAWLMRRSIHVDYDLEESQPATENTTQTADM